MPDELSDLELISRCTSGSDEGAWEQFVRRYSNLIWSAIHRTFRASSFFYAAEDAEDLFGAVFLSLVEHDFRSLREFQGRNNCSLSTWLTVVAARRTIDHMRRTSTRNLRFLEDLPEAAVAGLADGRETAEEILISTQRNAAFVSTLDALSAEDRKVYDLLFREGRSMESAADLLGITTAAIYTRKHRLIERLKKRLGGL